MRKIKRHYKLKRCFTVKVTNENELENIYLKIMGMFLQKRENDQKIKMDALLADGGYSVFSTGWGTSANQLSSMEKGSTQTLMDDDVGDEVERVRKRT